MRFASLLAFAIVCIPTAAPCSAQGLVDADRVRLLERLHRLDMGHTDWTLLRDIGDKAAALGSAAVPVIEAEIAAAQTHEDPRYSLRLLGVLARCDPARGTAKLGEALGSEDANTAAIAARVLGFCGLAGERVAAVVSARLPQEQRKGVANALALAAGDAGAGAVGPLLRDRLASGKLEADAVAWFGLAVAEIADKESQAKALEWLQGKTPMQASAVLLVRRMREPKAEARLLELLAAAAGNEGYRDWILGSLGACGGAATKAELKKQLAAEAVANGAEGVRVVAGQAEARQLALLRLGDAEQLAWAKGVIASHAETSNGEGPSLTMMSPSLARLPELFGKWNLPGGVEVMTACLADKKAPAWIRAHAARGLCWRRDIRGLQAAAALLTTENYPEHEFGVPEALHAAQQTLHEFVADADRPDCLVVERTGVELDDETHARAIAVGKQWQQWLQKKAGKVTWRDAPQDVQNLQYWY
jgi:hypothetical protein